MSTLELGVLAVSLVIIVMCTPLANLLASFLSVDGELSPADVIVVLSGGSYPDGVMSRWTLERTVCGIRLYKRGMASRILFAGGPPANARKVLGRYFFGSGDGTVKGVMSDACAMKKLAMEFGVPEEAIMEDEHSLHTYENLENAALLMREKGMKTALLVTSPLHMRRSMMVAKKIGLSFMPAPTHATDAHRKHPLERLILFHFALREYATLVLYKAKGWV
ncbi:MAG: YdcF family protein [Thermodesulfobacteriota bacterium]